MITTTFKAETSCVLLKSYKHHFECSVITLRQQQRDLSKYSQIYTAFMFALDAEPGSQRYDTGNQVNQI